MASILDLRGESDRIGRNLSSLGESLSTLVSEEERNRRLLTQTLAQSPQLLRPFAVDFNLSQDLLGETPDLSGLPGIDEDSLNLVIELLGPPTFEEKLDFARKRNPELTEDIIRAERAQAETTGRRLTTGLDLGEPEALAEANVAQAEATQAQSKFQRQLSESFVELGVPEQSALAQLSGFQAQTAQNEVQKDALERYSRYAASLPEDQQNLAATAMANRGFLSHLVALEQLDIQRLFAVARQSAASGDSFQIQAAKFELREKFNDEFADLGGQLKEAVENGAKGEIESILNRYNSLSDQFILAFPDDPVSIIDPVEAIIGSGAANVAFRTLDVDNIEDKVIAVKISNGLINPNSSEDFAELIKQDPQRANDILKLAQQLKIQTRKTFAERLLGDFSKIMSGAFNLATGAGVPTSVLSTFTGDPREQQIPEPKVQPDSISFDPSAEEPSSNFDQAFVDSVRVLIRDLDTDEEKRDELKSIGFNDDEIKELISGG